MAGFDRNSKESFFVVLAECLILAVIMVLAINGALTLLRLLAGGWHEWLFSYRRGAVH
jgi:hypothetical protein